MANKTPQMSSKEYQDSLKKAPKKSKYRNVKVTIDGITFDSKKEAKRYGELKLLEKSGDITELELQKKFPIIIGTTTVCSYYADFVYWCFKRSAYIVEDVKGLKTPVYNLKKKMVKAYYGITITEI